MIKRSDSQQNGTSLADLNFLRFHGGCLYHQFPTYTEILPFRNVFVHCERAVSGLNGVLTTCAESNTHTCAEE